MRASCLCSFSNTSSNFCVFSAGGIASVWNCSGDHGGNLISSTVLPNHLQSVCTCFEWSSVIKSGAETNKNADLVAYGSSNGCVYVLNVLTSSVTACPENGHTGSVASTAWHQNGYHLYTAADDGFMIEWNLKTNKLSRRWRSPYTDGRGRGGYTALAVPFFSENKLFAARQQIDLWDLQAGKVTQSFIGHSSDIFSLLPIRCNDGENNYILSLAKNDRVMYAWRYSFMLQSSNVSPCSPSAAFLLPDSAVSAKVSFNSESHVAQIFVVLSNGCIAVYRHVLNGKKITDPVRHVSIIEILPANVAKTTDQYGKSNTHINTNNHGKRLPVIDISAVSGGDMLTIAYGEISCPLFESLDMRSHINEKYVKLVREPFVSKANNKATDSSEKAPKPRLHIAAALPSSVRPGQKRTLGEKLKLKDGGNGGVKETAATSVLAQGLLSRDRKILDSIFGAPGADQLPKRNSENPKLIEDAIVSLDNQLLFVLLEELTARLASGHPVASQIAARWLAVLLRVRGSRLASASVSSGYFANNVVSNKLTQLRDTLIARTLDSSRVLQLRGRLRMLREMASSSSSQSTTQLSTRKLASSSSSSGKDSGVMGGNGIGTKAKSTSGTGVSRLPFVLPAADLSSDEESDDSALGVTAVKRRKRCEKYSNNSDDSNIGSEDDDFEDDDDDEDCGRRFDQASVSSDGESLSDDDGGAVLNGDVDDDEADGDDEALMDYGAVSDEAVAARKQNGVKKHDISSKFNKKSKKHYGHA